MYTPSRSARKHLTQEEVEGLATRIRKILVAASRADSKYPDEIRVRISGGHVKVAWFEGESFRGLCGPSVNHAKYTARNLVDLDDADLAAALEAMQDWCNH